MDSPPPMPGWPRPSRNRYPDALERIVRGHTQVAGNPATILVSLKNGYIHSDWFIKQGSASDKMRRHTWSPR